MADPKPQAAKKTLFRYLDKNPVKVATSNLFIDTESVPVDYMVGVVFGSIGGQELINYSMTELSGEENTSPIKDIYKINEKFSSNNILQTNRNSQNSNAPGTSEFTLDLLDYTLEVSDEASSTGYNYIVDRDTDIAETNPHIYINSNWQNIVINLSDATEGLILELDLVRFGETL